MSGKLAAGHHRQSEVGLPCTAIVYGVMGHNWRVRILFVQIQACEQGAWHRIEAIRASNEHKSTHKHNGQCGGDGAYSPKLGLGLKRGLFELDTARRIRWPIV